MFNSYRNSSMLQPSRFNSLFPSYSGFGNNRYRSTPTYPWNRYRPRYNIGWYRPFYDDSWWWRQPYHRPETLEYWDRESYDGSLAIQVNFLKDQNKEEHHTSDFGMLFAVRRGQKFTLKININRKFKKDQDHLEIDFTVGDRPQGSKNTFIKVHVDSKPPSDEDPYEWSSYVTNTEETSAKSTEVTIDVKAAADCIVGQYKMKISCHRIEGDKEVVAQHLEEEAYILFNAWCKDDQVFLNDEAERNEYIMEQTGRIFTGNNSKIGFRDWAFGQFSKVTIRTAVLLLKKSDVDIVAHGNATKVPRALSAMVNANRNGVLIGNWSGNYAGGISPTSWTGSVPILTKYLASRTGVKYGQCWVFAGLVTSLARSLGIPTRSVTNFDSAHDVDGSLTIDWHVNEEGDPLKHMNDSVWNFHVWNEGWFKRPDLPDGHDGWQAFDATPQEASEGEMQCGPASVKCVKEGEVYLNYDSGFIYSEVNGIRITWEVSRFYEYKIISMSSTGVGAKISTKAVNSSGRNDITLQYKYPEGSREEKEANRRALQFSQSRKKKEIEKYLASKVPSDVIFEYTSNMESNGDIKVEIRATNTTSQKRSFKLRISSHSTYYTGIVGEDLSKEIVPVNLGPNESDQKVWTLKAKDYLNEIDEDAMILVFLRAKVEPTGQMFIKKENFPLDKPELDIMVSNPSPRAGEEISVTMSFNNPVELALTEASFTLEGPGVMKEMIVKVEKSIPMYSKVSETVKVSPKYAGKRKIIAVFHSRQLVGITGSVDLNVLKA